MRVQRITPACAGKRILQLPAGKVQKDHPRVCGEKQCPLGKRRGYQGSPPRVRGKAMMFSSSFAFKGITPACAGKRPKLHLKPLKKWDHPRVCGEKLQRKGAGLVHRGSPPRVRGKVLNPFKSFLFCGITPACAGKRLKKAHKIKDFDPVPIRFHLVFRRFERWCSNLPTPDGNVPV